MSSFGGTTIAALGSIAGGVEFVSAGGTPVATTINGGALELETGASVTGPITFSLAWVALLFVHDAPANVISGFCAGRCHRPLRARLRQCRQLCSCKPATCCVISENGSYRRAQISISAQNFAGEVFNLRDDGVGGTEIDIGQACEHRPDGQLVSSGQTSHVPGDPERRHPQRPLRRHGGRQLRRRARIVSSGGLASWHHDLDRRRANHPIRRHGARHDHL